MIRLFAIVVLLLVLVPRVRADGADDQYVQIYTLIQDGDSCATNHAQALVKYNEALTALQRFQKVYPGWNDRVVNFRLNYLASKITILSGGTNVVHIAPVPARPPPPVAAAAPVRPPPAVPAPVAPPPPAPAPTKAVQQQPAAVTGLQNQIADLQNQLRQLQDDKSLLQAKLREALAARPAGVDPRDLARAQQQIRAMQKENDLLQVSLAQEQTKAVSIANSAELEQAKRELTEVKRQLTEQTARATQLDQENQSLQSRIHTLATNDEALTSLRMENEILKTLVDAKPSSRVPEVSGDVNRQLAEAQTKIAALESDKEVWRLEKIALQNRVKQLTESSAVASTPVWTEESAHVKQLERERDDLQKKLDAAQKELYGRNAKATAARVEELSEQLETLRARLDVYESTPVPYSAEELALFKKPDTEIMDPRAGKKSVRELPAGTIQLIAEAQRDFSARSYQQAEGKYLEVLRRDDKNADTLANLAAIQLEMGHLEDAEKNVKAALAVTPNDAYSLSILGNLKFRQEKYDEALDVLSRAAKLDPQNAEVQNFLGLTLSQKGMRNAAETAFRKAVILNPNYGGAQNNLAVFYLTQKPPSVELARWHYEKAVACGFPRNPEMEKLLNQKETAQNGQ
jgi:tetratricopeptide (TPR) repeat protein